MASFFFACFRNKNAKSSSQVSFVLSWYVHGLDF